MNIVQDLKLQLPVKKLQKMNRLLCETLPDSTLSPSYLSFETDIDIEIMNKLLTRLANANFIVPQIVIDCCNTDEDMIHRFTFVSQRALIDFIKKNNRVCPECLSEFDFDNGIVFFKTKPMYKEGI